MSPRTTRGVRAQTAHLFSLFGHISFLSVFIIVISIKKGKGGIWWLHMGMCWRTAKRAVPFCLFPSVFIPQRQEGESMEWLE